jgi:hypothetical protein
MLTLVGFDKFFNLYFGKNMNGVNGILTRNKIKKLEDIYKLDNICCRYLLDQIVMYTKGVDATRWH